MLERCGISACHNLLESLNIETGLPTNRSLCDKKVISGTKRSFIPNVYHPAKGNNCGA